MEVSERKLVTLREAATACLGDGFSFSQIRGWIYAGIAGRRLPTYRRPGDASTMLVDLNEVRAFPRVARRAEVRQRIVRGVGATNINLTSEQAEALRELARRYAKRLGLARLACRDAAWIAVQEALRREPPA